MVSGTAVGQSDCRTVGLCQNVGIMSKLCRKLCQNVIPGLRNRSFIFRRFPVHERARSRTVHEPFVHISAGCTPPFTNGPVHEPFTNRSFIFWRAVPHPFTNGPVHEPFTNRSFKFSLTRTDNTGARPEGGYAQLATPAGGKEGSLSL